jgi:hypothetical protein
MTMEDLIKEKIKDLYELVYEEGTECIGCEFNIDIKETRPWGDTRAIEYLRDCIIEDYCECPGVLRRERIWERK